MQVGHNRQDIEGGPDAALARPRSERLKLDALVDGYTKHAAYAMGRSDQLGSIEAGKRADFVVLKENLFEISRYKVHQTRPIAVVIDGELVFGNL